MRVRLWEIVLLASFHRERACFLLPPKLAATFDIDGLTQRELHRIVEGELLRRARISAAKSGNRHTPEACEKISQGRRRYFARLRAEKAATENAALGSELVEA
jgi:hypothetical protein